MYIQVVSMTRMVARECGGQRQLCRTSKTELSASWTSTPTMSYLGYRYINRLYLHYMHAVEHTCIYLSLTIRQVLKNKILYP